MRRAALLLVVALALAACSDDLEVAAGSTSRPDPATTTVPPSAVTPTTVLPTTVPSTSTTTTAGTTAASTTSTSTTAPSTTSTVAIRPAWYPQLGAAVADLSTGNAAVSVSVRRAGVEPYDVTIGSRNDGSRAEPSTPFVIASVSKLFTAVAVARLIEDGRIADTDRVPWAAMGLAHDPAWNPVTVRELLDHTSGMPENRASWLDEPATCIAPLEAALAAPPTATRGTWRYSNGNYCALGLLVEHVAGQRMDQAVEALVLGPAGASMPDDAYLARDGEQPTAAPYPKGVRRLLGLGGAGEWLATAPAVAAVVASITPADREVLRFPGLMLDQYGWGHTGTLDGAKACAWVIDDGSTVVVAMVAGQRPSTGGGVCDRLVPAITADLGLPLLGEPVRLPR